MPTHPFAILEHTMPDAGVHHDLLIELIDGSGNGVVISDPDAKTLWAVRIDPPPGDWLELGLLVLTPLPPHRRRYLTYEGPISRGRGSVRRVAHGVCEVEAEPGHKDHKTVRLTLAGQPLTLTITTDKQGRLIAQAH